MSEGLRLISAIVGAGSSNTLLRMDPSQFTQQELTAYEFVVGFFRQYREMPSVETIHRETNVRCPVAQENVNFYVDQVEERHIFNNVRERYAELREQMQARDVAGMRPIIENMYQTMRGSRERGHTVMGMGEALGLVNERLVTTTGYGGITGIETPWPGFNEITGGYQNADLVTFVGRPGVSKTYNLLYQAMGAHAAGHSVVFVTTEMGIEQLARRYAALRIGVNPELLKRNMVSTHTMRRIAALGAEMLEDLNFRIFSIGMGARVSAVEGLLQEVGPSICYIDGTYLLHPSSKTAMKRIERVADVFDELKGLTISANIPIVNTMQFNRQAGKGGVDGSLENIGFTDAVGMNSSLVLALKYGPSENERQTRTMEFLKGREGEIGAIHHNFRFAPVDLSEYIHVDSDTPAAAAGDAVGSDVDWMV